MIIIHGTRKLLERMKAFPFVRSGGDGAGNHDASNEGAASAWYGTYMAPGRRHIVVLMHVPTYACIVIPLTEFKDDPVKSIREAVDQILPRTGAPLPILERSLNMMVGSDDRVLFTTTSDRSLVSRLNNVADVIARHMRDDVSPEDVGVRMFHYLHGVKVQGSSASDYDTPADRLLRNIGADVATWSPQPELPPEILQLHASQKGESRSLVGKQADVATLRISLRDIKPPIWRTVTVPMDCTLDVLHRVVQGAMGWYDCHLHQFLYRTPVVKQEVLFIDPSQWEDKPMFIKWKDERSATLASLHLGRGGRLRYTYDMGDGWEHDIEVRSIDPPGHGPEPLGILSGRRACPPEDVGGTYGYKEFLHIMSNPAHPQYQMMKDWVGGNFDAEEFVLEHHQLMMDADL